MHTTQFPALLHCICLCVTVLRLQRPEVRIPPAAPRAVLFWALLFLFCIKLCGMLQGADSNSCIGDRRLRRKQGAGAGAAVAEGKPRPRGADRCGYRNSYGARRLRPGGQKQSAGLFLRRGLANPPGRSEQHLCGCCPFGYGRIRKRCPVKKDSACKAFLLGPVCHGVPQKLSAAGNFSVVVGSEPLIQHIQFSNAFLLGGCQ